MRGLIERYELGAKLLGTLFGRLQHSDDPVPNHRTYRIDLDNLIYEARIVVIVSVKTT